MKNLLNNWLKRLPECSGPLKTFQSQARTKLGSIGMPTRQNETWRLTNFERLKSFFDLPFASETSLLKQRQLPPCSSSAFRLVLNAETHNNIQSTTLPKGFRWLTNSELIEFLGRSTNNCEINNDWHVVFNNAITDRVIALYVDGSNLPPLEIVVDESEGSLSSSRIVLIISPHTKLDLQQILLGTNSSFHSHLLEVNLGEESVLKHDWVAFGSDNSSYLASFAIDQGINSHYELTSIQEGWSFSRFEPSIIHSSGYAKTILRGLQITNNDNQMSTNSIVRFNGPESCLDQLNKSVICDSSHSIFMGKIDVPQIAQRTNASQLSRNLLLSKNARIDTKPELTIVADDVKCSHGATVTELQEEELFYMRSRGIKSTDATRLLLKGYCEEILNGLSLNSDWNVTEKLIRTLKL